MKITGCAWVLRMEDRKRLFHRRLKPTDQGDLAGIRSAMGFIRHAINQGET